MIKVIFFPDIEDLDYDHLDYDPCIVCKNRFVDQLIRDHVICLVDGEPTDHGCLKFEKIKWESYEL